MGRLVLKMMPLLLVQEFLVLRRDLVEGHRDRLGRVAQERELGHLRVDEAARRVPVHGERDVGQAVLDRVVGAGRVGDAAREDVALHLAGGVLLEQVAPFLLRLAHAVRGRQPAGHREHRLRGSGHRKHSGSRQEEQGAFHSQDSLNGLHSTVRRACGGAGPDLPGFTDRMVGNRAVSPCRQGLEHSPWRGTVRCL
jgi:hypothetical protein